MKHYCVISHTHWDREWYKTQEQFRLSLIDLIDHLLEILDTQPDYIFHMDAQTIVFEDYWEIKPEMKEKCCRYIREGRILVGPWYVQNDFFLTSGEATVRNLLLGMDQANKMGHCSMTGYMPDQFGLISQLPQILRGFDINHCVFGRGYDGWYIDDAGNMQKEKRPAEFLWRSPDGSELLAICMSNWYNNAQRFSADVDRAVALTKNVATSFEGVATTPYLLLMNGVDHLEAQEDLLPILDEVQKRLPADEKIYQTTLEHYVEMVRNAVSTEDIAVHVGELKEGTHWNLLKDVTSSRQYLKSANSELQNMLENRLEPLYATLELNGMKGIYPSGQLDYLWKMLIRNHAHDSICGCSNDAVHRHMVDRFAAIREMGLDLQKRGMAALATHVNEKVDKEDYLIVVFNALEHERTELVEVEVDILAEDNPRGLAIISPTGEQVPYTLVREYSVNKSVFSPINLPGCIQVKRYLIRMVAKDIPAFGYLTYRIKTCREEEITIQKEVEVSKTDTGYCMENEYLQVYIHASGKVDLIHKENGDVYEDFLTVQDVADVGDVYMSYAMPNDVPIDVQEYTPCIDIKEADGLLGKACIHYEALLPKDYDRKRQMRNQEMVRVPIDIILELDALSRALKIGFKIENHAKDHRVRVLIKTGIFSDFTTASTPFDLTVRDKSSIDPRILNETEPNCGMVTIMDEGQGMSVLNRGIYGYENLQAEDGTLAFTILRCTSEIAGYLETGDGAWSAPENQCLRVVECEMAILPQCGEGIAERAAFASKAFQNPLLVQSEPADAHKFSGGRPAVQDTSIAELFYREIPYADVHMELKGHGITVDNDNLLITAFKKSYDRSGYILRFYNLKNHGVDTILKFGKLNISRVWKTNLKETARQELQILDNKVSIPVKEKEIVTLYLI